MNFISKMSAKLTLLYFSYPYSNVYYEDHVTHWIDIFLIDKLAESMALEDNEKIIRLLKGLADLCVCKGVPQKNVQGIILLPSEISS